MQSGSALAGKIPVFVFPNSVEFYLEDHKTHKRVLTVCNPYDFAVRFKVLCTAPDKYEVSGAEGKIKAKCQIDLVVRHKATSAINCNITDKFRVQMQHYQTKEIIGNKDIPATLHSGMPIPKQDDDDDRSATSADRASVDWKMSKMNSREPYSRDTKVMVKIQPSPLVWLTGVICFVCLLLPNEGEASSLTVPHHLKLVFSYVLGLVTMVIFRQ